jgi:hypothetical protein
MSKVGAKFTSAPQQTGATHLERKIDMTYNKPLCDPLLSLFFEGATINGHAPDPFRIYIALPTFNQVLGPFWAHKGGVQLYQGRIAGDLEGIEVRYALEPNGTAFTLGGQFHAVETNFNGTGCNRSGTFESQAVALRYSDSPLACGDLISMTLKFRWHLNSHVEDVLTHVMELMTARASMYGMRVLARRAQVCKRTPPLSAGPGDQPGLQQLRTLHLVLHQLYFAQLIQEGGPWDVCPSIEALFGDNCLDPVEGLHYTPESFNAFAYGYLGAAAGFTEEEVLAIPDCAATYRALSDIGLQTLVQHYLQHDGRGWLDMLAEHAHLQAEMLRLQRAFERSAYASRTDIAIPNALCFGYDLYHKYKGKVLPTPERLMRSIRSAGWPVI